MSHAANDAQLPAWLDLVRRKVEALRFGTIQIVVHDGRVTQVESTERVRLTDTPERGEPHKPPRPA